jgi:hypothetical protein
MAGFVFNAGAQLLLTNQTAWTGGRAKARLSETTETLNRDSATMTGLGLSNTSITLTGAGAPTINISTDQVQFTADVLVFQIVPAGPAIDKVIFFYDGGADSNSTPLAVVTFPEIVPNGGGVSVTANAAGFFATQQ